MSSEAGLVVQGKFARWMSERQSKEVPREDEEMELVAEAAALLILQKKVRALLGGEVE
ncbi:hypothetical protein HC024_14780 [Methylococcaceae bacterium WWC4]|nr:hypothetical protein [Methylococcaceae bacterium WWC4]